MATLKIDYFDTKEWLFLKYPLRLCGAWPTQPLRTRMMICPIIYMSVLAIYIPEVINLVKVRNNFIQLSDGLPMFGIHSVIVCSYGCFIINFEKIKELLLIVQQESTSDDLSPEESVLLKRETIEANKLSKMHTGFLYIAAVFFLFIIPSTPKILDKFYPLNESRPITVLYYTEYFIRDEKILRYITVYHYAISPLPTIIACAYNALSLTTCQHACNMLYIIGHRFSNIATTIEISNDNTGEIGNKLLTKYMTEHKAVLRYIELYHDCFANTSLVILILTVLILCLTGIQCLLRMDEKAELLRFGFCAAGVLFHTFILSECGQRFMDYSESLYEMTCQSEWYKLPVNLQKGMVIVMIAFSQPNHLKVGKIVTVSYENYLGIVRTSMSYFTVAHAVFL